MQLIGDSQYDLRDQSFCVELRQQMSLSKLRLDGNGQFECALKRVFDQRFVSEDGDNVSFLYIASRRWRPSEMDRGHAMGWREGVTAVSARIEETDQMSSMI